MTAWITQDVMREICRVGAMHHPLETGGTLLGWRDGSDRIITGLVGAGPRALHGRHTFLPDHEWQVEHMRKAFLQTAGDLDYLGDWHTHPDGVASMSEMDGKTLGRIERRVKVPLMLIAAGAGKDWTVKLWSGHRSAYFARCIPVTETMKACEVQENWPSYIVSDAEESGSALLWGCRA